MFTASWTAAGAANECKKYCMASGQHVIPPLAEWDAPQAGQYSFGAWSVMDFDQDEKA